MAGTTEKRRNVGISWKAGVYYQASKDFMTTGGEVFSYGHKIGYVWRSERTAYECHASKVTMAHFHAIRDFADHVVPCPEHPDTKHDLTHANKPRSSPPGHDPEALRTGIEAALGTILVMKSGNGKWTYRHVDRMYNGLHNILEGKGYYDQS